MRKLYKNKYVAALVVALVTLLSSFNAFAAQLPGLPDSDTFMDQINEFLAYLWHLTWDDGVQGSIMSWFKNTILFDPLSPLHFIIYLVVAVTVLLVGVKWIKKIRNIAS